MCGPLEIRVPSQLDRYVQFSSMWVLLDHGPSTQAQYYNKLHIYITVQSLARHWFVFPSFRGFSTKINMLHHDTKTKIEVDWFIES
jgi:hypothetical protein